MLCPIVLMRESILQMLYLNFRHVSELSGLTKLRYGVPFIEDIKNLETEPG